MMEDDPASFWDIAYFRPLNLQAVITTNRSGVHTRTRGPVEMVGCHFPPYTVELVLQHFDLLMLQSSPQGAAQ